jgi:hypothetical protein
VRERHTPNAPPVWFQRADLLEVRLVRNFPHQSSTAIVWRDDKSVSVVAGLGLKISDFAERETISANPTKNLKAIIDGSAWGWRNKCRVVA